MMNLNEFVTFATVIEEEGFSRAAEKLGISKALVSKHVSGLEESMGVKLINRTTRQIGLTVAGAIFYERCQQIMSHAEGARHELEQFRNNLGGVIRINSAIAFGRLHLVSAIAKFQRQNPNVSIELNLSKRFADLISGEADVVIRTAEEPRLLSLVARKLAPMRWVICATPEYLSKNPIGENVEELSTHNCIVYISNSKSEWVFKGRSETRTVKVKGNFKANNADGVLEAALEHMGVASLPTMAVSAYLKSGQLVRLFPEYQLPEKTLYAAYLPNPTMAQCVQSFVRFLSTEFGEHPYWDNE
jgi:LysR family transcriptional regulator, regulator for bpeEF and oprC